MWWLLVPQWQHWQHHRRFAAAWVTAPRCSVQECRAFELLRGQADRVNYLGTKHAKVVAMTCTHAALKRREFLKLGFRYDTLVMEESAQILEIETFIPMLLQQPQDGRNRLKRVRRHSTAVASRAPLALQFPPRTVLAARCAHLHPQRAAQSTCDRCCGSTVACDILRCQSLGFQECVHVPGAHVCSVKT